VCGVFAEGGISMEVIASYLFLLFVIVLSWKLGDIFGTNSRRRLREAERHKQAASEASMRPLPREQNIEEWLATAAKDPAFDMTAEPDKQVRGFPRKSNRRH
jgi:hypothetical protein